MLSTLAIIYGIAAKTAQSYNIVIIYQTLFDREGLVSMLTVMVVMAFLIVRFAKNRVSGVTINSSGIQMDRIGAESIWINWSQIRHHAVSPYKVVLESISGDTIDLPLWLFSASQRKAIIEKSRRYLDPYKPVAV